MWYDNRCGEVWLSLVERHVRDVEAAGSNPVTSTNTLQQSGGLLEGIFERRHRFHRKPTECSMNSTLSKPQAVPRNRQSNFANAELTLVTIDQKRDPNRGLFYVSVFVHCLDRQNPKARHSNADRRYHIIRHRDAQCAADHDKYTHSQCDACECTVRYFHKLCVL